jgi:plastocyanin domain-containing protein
MRFLATAALVATLAAAPASAAGKDEGRTVEVKVTMDGFVPDRIPARKGEPLTLLVTRTTDTTCATEIVIKDLGIEVKLPLGKAVPVRLTPTRSGQLRFACGMDMIAGVIVVE